MVDTEDGRVTLGILKTQLADLKEFLAHRLDVIDVKVERSCVKMENLETKVDKVEDKADSNSHTLEKHDLRITTVEKFQRNLLAAVIKWGSLGAGVAITIIVIAIAVFRSWGWI